MVKCIPLFVDLSGIQDGIARNDKTSFPGFDQDEYMSTVNANKRSKASLIEEYRNVRKATISLLGSLDKEALSNIGTASQSNLSARAAGG